MLEDAWAHDEKLLVARDINICVELCGWRWCMPEGESLSRDASREVNAEPYSKRALDGYFHGFYYGTTWSSRLWCNTCCMWQIHKTKVHIIPTMKEMNSLGLARLYQDHIWKLHGLPNMVISDHGPHLHQDSWKNSIKYQGSTQNYLLPITCRQMDRQRGWIRSWSNIWGCSWTTTKRIGWSGWQLLNSHI